MTPRARAPGRGGLFGRTLSGMKWSLLAEAGEALLALGIVMTLARLLTPAQFGQVAAAMIFVALADTVVRQGLGPALVQRFALNRRHLATGFALSLGAGLALAGVLFAFAPRLAALAGAPDGAALLQTLALVTALTGFGVVSEHRLRRALRFRALAGASLLAKGLGYGCVAIALALAGQGAWALAGGIVAHQALFTLAVLALAPPRRGFGTRRREAGELMQTGAGFSALGLLGVVSGRTVNLIIARSLGADALGLFTRAQGLALAPARLSPALSGVLLPAMARRQRRPARLRAATLDAVAMLSLAALPACAALALSAPQVVAVVLGPQWAGAAPVLSILALAGVLQLFNAIHVPVIRALGAVWRETRLRLLYLVLLAGAAWWAARFGLAAVAGAVALAWAVRHVLLVRLALALLDVRAATLWRRHLPGLWAGLWAGLGVLAAQAAHAGAWPAPAALALQMGAAAGAGAAAVYFAPARVRPGHAVRGFARLPFERMGPPGRLAQSVLEHLARRGPRPSPAAEME